MTYGNKLQIKNVFNDKMHNATYLKGSLPTEKNE